MPRQLLRYRIRTLLVVVGVLSCGLGFYRARVGQFRAAQAKVEALDLLCLRFSDDSFVVPAKSDSNRTSAARDSWVDWTLGRFPSQEVVAVVLKFDERAPSSAVYDLLDRLSQFPSIYRVNAADSAVDDAMVDRLTQSCPNLRKLDLSSTQITDLATISIARLEQLEWLDCSNTQLTGSGFWMIGAACPNLHELNLGGTHLSESGVEELLECASLRTVWLGSVETESLLRKHLHRLPHLETMTLNGRHLNVERKAPEDGLRD